ncbi:group XIIA secretory phospholipase A2 isoform X2 [Neovison vison]|uniref:group XIIA secretory phospholipase A2 isoform X2 n=1 Tax=Neovison vison TaxID=452646 RepID=UPI001CF081E5|nr:group XIIA secretory phospholipase A2 isoform X2 [Neogale vison]
MALLPRHALAFVLLLFVPAALRCQEQAQTTDWRATLKTIRNGVHKIDTYLNAALDLLGGEDGLCQYKCNDGSKPFPRYGYKPSPPNGCGSPLFGVHLNIGIPSLTKCCNQHDRCYETCGKSKNDCDEEFQYCLSKICRDVQKTLGLAQHVQGSPKPPPDLLGGLTGFSKYSYSERRDTKQSHKGKRCISVPIYKIIPMS